MLLDSVYKGKSFQSYLFIIILFDNLTLIQREEKENMISGEGLKPFKTCYAQLGEGAFPFIHKTSYLVGCETK